MSSPPLLRTSERKDFKRCPWLWEQTWLRGIGTKRVPAWSWFGTAIHAGLEAWYKPGKRRGGTTKMLAAFDASMDKHTGRIRTEGLELDEDELVDARELGHAMLLGYVEHYGQEPHLKVIHAEQPFQLDVPHPTKKNETLVVYLGTWDLFVRDLTTGKLWLWDHKTRKSMLQDWSYLELDDQPGSYLWVAKTWLVHEGLMDPDEEIEGIQFNFLKKALPDPRPVNEEGQSLNKDGSVSKRQPAARYHREPVYRSPEEAVSLAKRVQSEAIVMDKFRRGKLPIYKTPAEDCPRCKIFEYCALNEADPEAAEEFARATMRKRDYYRDHREAMEEKDGVQL